MLIVSHQKSDTHTMKEREETKETNAIDRRNISTDVEKRKNKSVKD